MVYAQSLDEDIPEPVILMSWIKWRKWWFFEHPILKNFCELVILITCGDRVRNNNVLCSDQPYFNFYRSKTSDSDYMFWINRIRADSSFKPNHNVHLIHYPHCLIFLAMLLFKSHREQKRTQEKHTENCRINISIMIFKTVSYHMWPDLSLSVSVSVGSFRNKGLLIKVQLEMSSVNMLHFCYLNEAWFYISLRNYRQDLV